jgi:hypothetical protein
LPASHWPPGGRRIAARSASGGRAAAVLGVWQHGRLKSQCKDCGTGCCQHGRLKGKCKDCGTGYCQHGRLKSRCKYCGTGCCQHRRLKDHCTDCGTGHCQHGRKKGKKCRDCSESLDRKQEVDPQGFRTRVTARSAGSNAGEAGEGDPERGGGLTCGQVIPAMRARDQVQGGWGARGARGGWGGWREAKGGGGWRAGEGGRGGGFFGRRG